MYYSNNSVKLSDNFEEAKLFSKSLQ